MAAVDTTSDVEILEALDFDPDLACEVEHNGRHCGAVAAYVARTVCCSRSHLMCQGCVDHWRKACSAVRWIKCGWCPNGLVSSFDELVDLIPIGGRS